MFRQNRLQKWALRIVDLLALLNSSMNRRFALTLALSQEERGQENKRVESNLSPLAPLLLRKKGLGDEGNF